jgi:gliding motility-associated-like protein
MLFPLFLKAQTEPREIGGIINAYSKVTNIDTDCHFVTVAAPDLFQSGDKVLLIQMQGAMINETNTASFGDVLDYQHAGNYEFADISFINGSNIYFEKKILRTYDPNASVQLVRTPVYDDAIVTSELTCPDWNGNTGGIISLIVNGTIELRAKINSSGKGFRGGRRVDFESFECSYFDYVASFNQGIGGQKGEGIAQYITGQEYARGKNANGGGGGNVHNTGGGGGSNGGAGGMGGSEWSGCSIQSVNVGIGGAGIDFNQANQKVFMGGGGGGGNQDNDVGTDGVPGGGINILIFDRLITNMHGIEAFGQIQTINAGIDSGGGGGGGGTVLLSGNEIVGNLIVNIAGGAGGNIADHRYSTSNQWGPGGGGGGGLLWLSDALSSSSINLNMAGGQAGNTPLNNSWGATAGEPGLRLSGLKIPEGTPNEDTMTEMTLTFCKNDPVKILQLNCNGLASWIVPFSDSIFSNTELDISTLEDDLEVIGLCGDLYCPDSIITFNIQMEDQVHQESEVQLCIGDSILVNGNWYYEAGIISYEIASAKACKDSITVRVEEFMCNNNLFVPDAFSPNSDGINDAFKSYGPPVTDYYIRIYDRWGELVFESNDQNKGWDGTFRNKLMLAGVFVYVISYSFIDVLNNSALKQNTLQGEFYLKR